MVSSYPRWEIRPGIAKSQKARHHSLAACFSWQLAALAWTLCAASKVAFGQGLGTHVAVSSAAQLFFALTNSSITDIQLTQNIDMEPSRALWGATGGPILRTADVALRGSPSTDNPYYPQLDLQYMSNLLSLSPGLVFNITNLKMKRTTRHEANPDLVKPSPGTTMYIHDCLMEFHHILPYGKAWTSLFRPDWAPGNNRFHNLTDGVCRNDSIPSCAVAVMMVDMAHSMSTPAELAIRQFMTNTVYSGLSYLTDSCPLDSQIEACEQALQIATTITALSSPFCALQPTSPRPAPAALSFLDAFPQALFTTCWAPAWKMKNMLLIQPGVKATSIKFHNAWIVCDEAMDVACEQEWEKGNTACVASRVAALSATQSSAPESSDSSDWQLAVGLAVVLGGAAVIGAVVAAVLVMRARRKRQQAELPTHVKAVDKEASLTDPGHTLGIDSSGTISSADLTVVNVHAMYLNLAEHAGKPPLPALTASQNITKKTPLVDGLALQVDVKRDLVVQQVIGTGAYGVVHQGLYRGQPVALKLFPTDASADTYLQEYNILARMRHPNIVSFLGVGSDELHIYLILELCNISLDKLLYTHQSAAARAKPVPRPDGSVAPVDPSSPAPTPTLLPLPFILSVATQVAQGLAYLHPTIIHRDLKPSNILINIVPKVEGTPTDMSTSTALTSSSSEGTVAGSQELDAAPAVVKLADFGQSRMMASVVLKTGRPAAGTLPYMAPECFNKGGPGIGSMCDIYSFGLVLWELIHGQQPWPALDPALLLFQVVVQQKRPAFTASEDRCPPRLRELIERCWDNDPQSRPVAQEVIRELKWLTARFDRSYQAACQHAAYTFAHDPVATERALCPHVPGPPQEAFEEEGRKHERLRERLESKVVAKTAQAAETAQEVQAAQVQLAQLCQQLERSQEEAGRKLSLLQSELEGMQARHAGATAALQAAHESALAEERHRANRLRKELEVEVERLAASGGARSLEEQASTRLLQSRVEVLQGEVSAQASALSQRQHSLYLVRAHWGTLKRLMMRLQAAVREGAAARGALATVGDSGGASAEAALLREGAMDESASHLMCDWDPTHKAVFDAAVEESLTAACALLDHALGEWQALVQQAHHTAATAGALAAAQQASHVTVHPLLHAAQLQLKQAQDQAASSDRAASAARMTAAEVGERLASAQNEVHTLERELTAQQDAVREAQQAASHADTERRQLRLALQGSKGELESLLASRDAELAEARRTLDDLRTTVGVMHVRLEHVQSNWAQLDELKSRLSGVMAAASVPTLVPAGATDQGRPPQSSQAPSTGLANLLTTILHGGASTATTAGSAGVVDSSSAGVQSRLDSAVRDLLSQAEAAVAGCGLMEVSHWEVERGLEGVRVVRDHMAALNTELAAGRTTSAAVLVKELLAVLDAPTHAASAPAASTPSSAVSKVHVDLHASRQAALEVASRTQTMMALTRALSNTMPTWAQITRAEAQSSFRGELSRMRSVMSQQVGAWGQQGASAAAGVGEARAAASQYVKAVECSLTELAQQLEDIRQAGGLSGDDTSQQQLAELEVSRRQLADRLQRLLEAAEAKVLQQVPLAAEQEGQQPAGNAAAVQLPQLEPTAQPAAAGQPALVAATLPAAAVSAGVPLMGPGPVLQTPHRTGRLMEPVAHLQDAVINIRGDLASLQSDNQALAQDRTALRAHLKAIRQRTTRLMHALGAALPLTPDLVRGLQDGVVGFLEVPPRDGDDDADVMAVGEDEEEEADRLLRASLTMMQELVGRYVSQVHASSSASTSASLGVGVVEPLRARCSQLEGQLAHTQREMHALEVQVCELLGESDARLAGVREACSTAALAVLDTALSTIRQEVQQVESQMRSLQDQSRHVIGSAGQEWAAAVVAASSSASRAVAALTTTAAALQAQLAGEQQAHEQTRAEASATLRTTTELRDASTAELTRTKSHLMVAQQQLGHAEADQEVLEREAAELRQSLRLRVTARLMEEDRGEGARAGEPGGVS